MAEKRCYTVKELQEILGVSRPTVYNLLKKNEFRWIQLDGGKYRISKKSLSYMGNGMGFELHDSSLPDYLDGPMTLIKGHTIYADNIDSISYYREHPLVLEAIQELRERFPDFKYFMTAQEKQDIYPEHMTAEAIAYALVDLAEDFDTYEFRDNVDDKETLVKEIEYDLYAGRGKKEYAGFLKDVMVKVMN